MHPKILNVLAKQQADLVKNPPDGVIFYQDEDGDVTNMQADIIGPCDTPFIGGVFRCKLVIDNEFPAKPPKGFFLTKIFHPNVAQPLGDICVNTLKRDWDPKKWSLSHIFQIIKCLLIVPFPESALNEEAGRLFMESYDDFSNQARLLTQIHAMPNQKQIEIMDQMEQKQKKELQKKEVAQKVESNLSSQGGIFTSFDNQINSSSFSGKQETTFSLGQGSSSSQINQGSFLMGGSSIGVLGLSQVPNSMNIGMNDQNQNIDQNKFGGQFVDQKFGQQNKNANTFSLSSGGENNLISPSLGFGNNAGNSLFGFQNQDDNGLFGGPSLGSQNSQQMMSTQDSQVPMGLGGFGNQDMNFGMGGGLGIGLGSQQQMQNQGGMFGFGQGPSEQFGGLQVSQQMSGGSMIQPSKNKKKIGGKCRI